MKKEKAKTPTAMLKPDPVLDELEPFFEAIARELKRLDRPSWMKPIRTVIDNCARCPIDWDEWLPEVQILEILKSLSPAGKDPLWPFIQFRSRFSDMECFTYRSYRITDAGPSYWYPLTQRYREFVAAGGTRTYQVDVAYPSRDIIEHWLNFQLPKKERLP